MAINVNRIIAEAQRDSVPLTIGDKTYQLPGEFPLDVLAPFLDDDLDLADVIAEIAAKVNEDKSDEGLISIALDALFDHPALPIKLIKTAGKAAESLLGPEAYAAFWSLRPGLPAIRAFWKELAAHYSVSLTDFSESADSSETTGELSKPTSSTGTEKTLEPSGDALETPAGS